MNKLPPVTKNLLIINVLCWMGTLALSKMNIDLNSIFGLHFIKSPDFHLWQPITYMFFHQSFVLDETYRLHIAFQHIFFNMFAVWMFGRVMEIQWGSKRFLIFYLICGIGAGLSQELCQFIHYLHSVANNSTIEIRGAIYPMALYIKSVSTVGASGAIFGILLGYGMTFPNNPLFIIPFPFPIKAKWLVFGYGALELILGIGNSAADNVAHFAHLGGMLAGFLMILYWKHKEKKDNHIKFTW